MTYRLFVTPWRDRIGITPDVKPPRLRQTITVSPAADPLPLLAALSAKAAADAGRGSTVTVKDDAGVILWEVKDEPVRPS